MATASKTSTATNDDAPHPKTVDVSESAVRPSISVRMIRHAESNNNQVYRNARYIYRGGTPDFDEAGWWHYVESHRRADPSLSEPGLVQADHLARYLGPHLQRQASQPVHIITSPMRRTLETIRPTIEYLVQQAQHPVHVTVQAFYYGKAPQTWLSNTFMRIILDVPFSHAIYLVFFPYRMQPQKATDVTPKMRPKKA